MIPADRVRHTDPSLPHGQDRTARRGCAAAGDRSAAAGPAVRAGNGPPRPGSAVRDASMVTAAIPVTTPPLWQAGGVRRSARPARRPPRRDSRGRRSRWRRSRCRCRCARRRLGRRRTRSSANPRQRSMPNPVGTDLLGPDPGQLPAQAGPQMVIPAGGDRAAVRVPQQLPLGRGVPLPGVLDQAAHQSGGDRLPADSLALFPQPDQVLIRVQVLRA